MQSAGALFGVLLTQKTVVAVAQSRAHVLHPHDLLLLANLVRSNESFRQAQTFTPLCLPHFNPTAFLHAYVQYLHVVSLPFRCSLLLPSPWFPSSSSPFPLLPPPFLFLFTFLPFFLHVVSGVEGGQTQNDGQLVAQLLTYCLLEKLLILKLRIQACVAVATNLFPAFA